MVAGGAAASQAISLLVSPLLTRLYAPEAFGHLGIFLGVAVPLSLVATLRYDVAVVLPRVERDAAGLVVLGIISTAFITAVVGLMAPLTAPLLARFGGGILAEHYWMLPTMLFISGIFSAFRHWLIRRKRFDVMAFWSPVSVATGNGFKVAAGAIVGTAPFLIIGNLVLQAMQAIVWLVTSIAGGWWSIARRVRVHDIALQAARFRDFPFFRLPRDVLGALHRHAPGLLFAFYYSPAMAGIYLLALRMLELPTSLVGGAVKSVFYQRAAELADDPVVLWREFQRKTVILVLVGIPQFAIIAVIAPFTFGFIFGEAWREAGVAAAWLCLATFGEFVASAALAIIPVIRVQKQYLIFEGMLAATSIAVILIAGRHTSFITTVALLSSVTTVAYCLLGVWVWRYLRMNTQKS